MRFILITALSLLLSANLGGTAWAGAQQQKGRVPQQGAKNEKQQMFMQSNRSLDVFVPIAKYIKAGDAAKLSLWIDNSLDLQCLGISSQCSKVQATHILRNFFRDYPPKDFVIIHKSGQAPAKYAIGTLNCGDSKFRVTLYAKTEEGKTTIQQMLIERD